MKRFDVVFLFGLFVLNACVGGMEAKPGQDNLPATFTAVVPVRATGIILPTVTPADPYTRIKIDGDGLDWQGRVVLFSGNPANGSDASLGEVYSFKNDLFLYLMFKMKNPSASYKQIDIDINPSGGAFPEFMLNLGRTEGGFDTHFARSENGQLMTIADGVEFAHADVFELRIPLSAFGDKPVRQVSIRVMDGTCCGAGWMVTSSSGWVLVEQAADVEKPTNHAIDLEQDDSAFCTQAAQVSEVALPGAPTIKTLPGYSAGWLVSPSGLNVPSDVATGPDGNFYVASSRSGAIYKITPQGEISVFAAESVYALDVDSSGNVYGYFMPSGEINRFSAGGTKQVIGRMPESACESTLAVSDGGDVYIGFNQCKGNYEGTSGLYLLKAGMSSPQLLVEADVIQAVDVSPDGEVLVVMGSDLLRYDPASGSLVKLLDLPGYGSFHSLVVGVGGTAYVTVVSAGHEGVLYRVRDFRTVERVAGIPENVFEGIAISADGDVVGVQRSIGGMQKVAQDGTLHPIIRPNGLVSPQTLSVTPCGEVLSVNDEAGSLGIAYPAGGAHSFTGLTSFQPPQTTLAFSPWGWFATAESAPGFPSVVRKFYPNQKSETFTENIPWVSGVAVDAGQNVYVSSCTEGKIYRLLADGSRDVFVSGLDNPQGLAISSDGTLYAIYGGGGSGAVFFAPMYGEGVLRISTGGEVTSLLSGHITAQIALGPDGLLYGAGGSEIFRVLPSGKVEVVAWGFQSVRGLAFGIAGEIYAADDVANAIVKIAPVAKTVMTGTVLDAEGNGLGGVRVRLTQAHPPYAGSMTISGANGAFSIPALADQYELVYWLPGKAPQTYLPPLDATDVRVVVK